MLAHETLVIAHRGAWGELPENTLEAFEEAIRLGADMVELDVRRAVEGQLVVHHDELRPGGADTRPPLLEDVVREMAGRIPLNLELKERGCTTEVVAILRRYGVEDCLISSFLDDVVREAKAVAPHVPTGLVVGGASAEEPAIRALRCDADRLVLELGLADQAARSGIPSLVWTVNDADAIDRVLADPAIVGVITDRPALALERRSLISGRTARAERS
jgi:glycerophosphoryl diester phosphodiesterase